MNLLALLATLLIGVLLGYWLQNPALADRERAARQKLRRAKALWYDAQTKLDIAASHLRFAQAVREQAAQMVAFLGQAPELDTGRTSTPLFDSMTDWLAPTGTYAVVDEPEPKARKQLAKRMKTKPAELVAS